MNVCFIIFLISLDTPCCVPLGNVRKFWMVTMIVLWNFCLVFENAGKITKFTWYTISKKIQATLRNSRYLILWGKYSIFFLSMWCIKMFQCLKIAQFLGGLSLHLNHLIGSCVANYDWPFGTLPFGLFWSNLDTGDLETYPRTYFGNFWNMSIFYHSRAIWVLFRKWVVSENQSFLDEGAIVTSLIGLVLGEVSRLNHWPICFPIQNT